MQFTKSRQSVETGLQMIVAKIDILTLNFVFVTASESKK